MDWCIVITKKGCASDYPDTPHDGNDAVLVNVQDMTMEVCFARAYVALADWLTNMMGGEPAMKCGDCLHNGRKAMCEACKRMQQEGIWKWEIENGCRRIRCPWCGKSLTFDFYGYSNPYRFCPYCGKQMIGLEKDLFGGED